jgi:hypothetical protein
MKLNIPRSWPAPYCNLKQQLRHKGGSDMRLTKTVSLAAILTGLFAAAPARAQTTIDFTGTDGTAMMTGTAEMTGEGFGPLLTFDVSITNLLADGGPADSVSFDLADVADGVWYDPSNPEGIGVATFTFNLNADGPNQSIYSGSSCFYDCFALTSGDFETIFTTSVTSYSVREPASVAILGMGLLGLGGYRMRRRGFACA